MDRDVPVLPEIVNCFCIPEMKERKSGINKEKDYELYIIELEMGCPYPVLLPPLPPFHSVPPPVLLPRFKKEIPLLKKAFPDPQTFLH